MQKLDAKNPVDFVRKVLDHHGSRFFRQAVPKLMPVKAAPAWGLISGLSSGGIESVLIRESRQWLLVPIGKATSNCPLSPVRSSYSQQFRSRKRSGFT